MKRIIVAGIAGMALLAPLTAVAQAPNQPVPAAGGHSDFPLARARAKSAGEAIYLAKCQYCHVEMGPGTITLAKRVGQDKAMLAMRTDLTADYVKAVVRSGVNTMPPISRVEVSDAELDQIAHYLARTSSGQRKRGR